MRWKELSESVCPYWRRYDLRPLDIYLAAFGPALEVISNNWPIRRELANPRRPDDPFAVTPNDALQVARREVFAARRRHASATCGPTTPAMPLTEFYILSQDSVGFRHHPIRRSQHGGPLHRPRVERRPGQANL